MMIQEEAYMTQQDLQVGCCTEQYWNNQFEMHGNMAASVGYQRKPTSAL